MKKIVKRELYVMLFFTLLVFIFKISTFFVPFHWDELGVDIPASIYVLNHNFTIFPGDIALGHPPLTYLIFAIFFKIFGLSIFAVRIPLLIANIASLFFTYKIGKTLYDENVGLLSAVTLFFLPVYFSQSGLAMSTTIFIPFALGAVYFAIKKEIKPYMLFSTLAILTRETGLLLAGILCVYLWLQKISMKDKLILLTPFFVFFIWVIINKIIYGWFISPLTTGLITFFPNLHIVKLIFNEFFISQSRFILTIIFIYLLTKNRTYEENILITLIIAHIVVFAIFLKFMLPRYVVFLYPIFIILTIGTTGKIKISYGFLLTCILIVLFISSWHGHRDTPAGWGLETNMEYIDLVNSHKAASEFIETNYPNSLVYTCWPMDRELSEPINGYVKKKINVTTIWDTNSPPDIIYYSVQSNCYDLLEKIDITDFSLAKEFNVNSKIARIYIRV